MPNQSRERALKDLPSNVITEIKGLIRPNEMIISCFETEQETYGEASGKSYFVHVITQTQAISYSHYVSRGYNQKHVDTMQLIDMDYVSESELGKYRFNVDVTSNTSNKKIFFEFASREVMKKFAGILRQALTNAKASSATHSPSKSSSAKTIQERLQDLLQLRKAGLITDVEYEETRKRIIAGI
jgi:hypothetical protein